MTPSQDLLDRLSLFAVLTDEAGLVVRTNACMEELDRDLLGKPFHESAMPQGFSPMRQKAGDDGRFTTAIELEEGRRLIEWRPSEIDTGTLWLGLDVTRDRESWQHLKTLAKTAADASESKMRFLATMSHEMRTPLNGILGMTGLLLDTGLDPNQKAYAEAVRESGSALLGLINDILDYSKIEASKFELDDHPFDPAALVQSVTELLSPRAAHKDLEIASFVSPKVPARLRGDEGRLRQVLLNLAGNGVKFTEEGGVIIELHGDTLPDGRTAMRFVVRDSGIGITEAAAQKIFEEFAQADETRARQYEGTGLGLTIAQRIVGAMGGRITVDSRVGEGSEFTFTVPLEAVSAEPGGTFTAPENSVVVATASPILRRALALKLDALRVRRTVFVETAEEAAAALAREGRATLLCDLPIAAAAGQKLTKAADHALVLLSPLARGRLEAFKRAGFDGYLIKPIRQASLAERLVTKGEELKPQQRLDAAGLAPKRQGAKRRVLLAEDNQINAVLATAIIKRAGHHVDVAGNGQEALETLSQAPYDIVLMDMHMPVMDGLEATRRLRDLPDPASARLPVIALTANAMRADRETCLEAGMNDFLSKPFDPSDLLSMIERWTGEAQGETQEAS
ncbi:response regulator [Parvularcula oceani]|uniref:response regulator n=1 Tax=Parvularcula oceani TaxID=1247963 RepID=UPI00068B9730|nr:response regulator [Parvularcula oceani]